MFLAVAMDINKNTINDFLKEALKMRRFSHPNVLNLIGISCCEEVPCAILPLMKNGDLKHFLQCNAKVIKREKTLES